LTLTPEWPLQLAEEAAFDDQHALSAG
jgi:hypothetical protein